MRIPITIKIGITVSTKVFRVAPESNASHKDVVELYIQFASFESSTRPIGSKTPTRIMETTIVINVLALSFISVHSALLSNRSPVALLTQLEISSFSTDLEKTPG